MVVGVKEGVECWLKLEVEVSRDSVSVRHYKPVARLGHYDPK